MSDTLRTSVAAAIAELLSKTAFPERYQYATQIREIGERLQLALDNDEIDSPALRPDVKAFAVKMSKVMQDKEETKGSADTMPMIEALGSLDMNTKKLQEFGILGQKEEVRRILIHIANFAMIAERKL